MKEHPDGVIEAVAHRALREWDLADAEVTIVARSENVVFRVDATDGGRYALRVHRPGYHTLAELESEPLWTAALNEAGIAAPVAVPTRAGDHYATIDIPGTGEIRHVGLVPWFDGRPLDELIDRSCHDAAATQFERLGHFERLGRLMAHMHNQAAAWQPPPSFSRHAFDADGFMGDAPFWGRFWDVPGLTSGRRDTLVAARRRIHARLSEYGKQRGTYSMIHADLHAANVLIAEDHVHVIDFDDAGFGWHQYDIAVALSDHVESPGYEPARNALVAGYRTGRAISDDDLALLPLFLLVRKLAGLGWLHARPELDDYEYLPARIEAACAAAEEYLGSS